MIRTVLYENALRAHRLRIFERLPGAPIPCPLEELDEVTRACWELLFDFERRGQEVRP
jgi:hypothetical protein